MEKKKVLTAVAVGAATVAAGVSASQVHADSVTVTKQQVGDETKVTTTTVKDNASQAKIAKDKQAVSDQQNVVDKAKASMDSAQSKVNQDSANTAAAQKKVDDAKSKLDSAKANTDTTQVKNKINSDQQQISNDQNQISNVKNDISTDQGNISKDKQAISNASQNAKDDQAKLTQDQNSLSNANSQLENDKNKVSDTQSQINALNNQASNVPTITVSDESKVYLRGLSQCNDQDVGQDAWNDYYNSPAVQQFLKDHNETMDQYEKADEPNDKWGHPIYTPGTMQYERYHQYVNIPNDSYGSADAQQDPYDDQAGLAWVGQTFGVSNSGHVGGYNSSADNYQIDPTNLTPSEMKEINIFAIEIINEYRESIGLTPFRLTQGIIDMAGNVASNYNKDNWSAGDKGHDMTAYTGVGFNAEDAAPDRLSESTLESTDKFNNGSRPGASPEYTSDLAHHFTMNNLKTVVAQAIESFMKAPDGHAQAIMDPNAVAAGLSVNKYGDILLDFVYNNNDGNQQASATSALQGQSVLPANTANVAQQKANLENQLSQEQQAVQNDQQTINSLTNQVNADKAKLAQDTPAGLTDQLNKDQQQLANDQAKLSNLQKDLADAQSQLTQDQNALKNVNSPAAQAALAQAQQDYANAVKDLNDAQSQENTDRAALAQFQQDYADALAKLNELETILKNDEGETTTVSVQWIKNQHPATTSEISNRYVLGNNARQNSASQAATNRTVSQFDGMEEVQAAEVPGLRRSNRNNGLPDTGDRQNNAASVAGLLGLGLAGILSMFGLAERKKQA